MQDCALGCLGLLELERLWPARSCDVGTGRAPLVVRSCSTFTLVPKASYRRIKALK